MTIQLFQYRSLIETFMTPMVDDDEFDDSELEEEKSKLRRLEITLEGTNASIVEANLGLVRDFVRPLAAFASVEDARDFERAGELGLMRAIDSYRPKRGGFAQWALFAVKKEVLEAVRVAQHPSLSAKDFAKRPRILSEVPALIEGGGSDRCVSHADVAAKAYAPVEQVARVLDAPRIESLSTPVGDSGHTMEDFLECRDDDTEEVRSDRVLTRELVDDLSRLTPRQRVVISSRFGLDGGPCLSSREVGELLGISSNAALKVEARDRAKFMDVRLERTARESSEKAATSLRIH